MFEDHLYLRIWSEPTLNQLDQLFQTEKPSEDLFEAELEEIRKRTIAVKEVNDFFFGIVDPNTTSKNLCELLAKLQCLVAANRPQPAPTPFTQSVRSIHCAGRTRFLPLLKRAFAGGRLGRERSCLTFGVGAPCRGETRRSPRRGRWRGTPWLLRG